MAKRKIVNIDENKCDGCGKCIPRCPEGAIQIIDGKARLISDLFCDGLGACLGHCPQGAIYIKERDAASFDEKRAMAHLSGSRSHQGHGESGCPGAHVIDIRKSDKDIKKDKGRIKGSKPHSQLRQWPIQIMLVPPGAPYLDGADILIAADCVPFAYAGFHDELLRGRVLLVGCPKLDDIDIYREKFTEIFKHNDVKSVACAHMEVPCCFGLVSAIKAAISKSGKNIPFAEVVIGINGARQR
jgi:NAD-dependent dihydropyrimidine dehydrogenase PreA subunit